MRNAVVSSAACRHGDVLERDAAGTAGAGRRALAKRRRGMTPLHAWITPPSSVAQEPEQPAHLDERVTARSLDRVQGASALLGIDVEHTLRSSRLRDDHAHVVRHHVVELPGDHTTFVDHRPQRSLLAFALEPRRPMLEEHHLAAFDAKPVADEPDGADHDAAGQDRVDRHRLRRDDEDRENGTTARERRGYRDPPSAVRRHRAQRQQHPERRERGGVPEREVQEHRRSADGEHRDRRPTAPHQRHRLEQREHETEGVHGTVPRLFAVRREVELQILEQADERHRRQERGDERVLDDGVREGSLA